MSTEALANFDSYVWVAVGLFVASLFAVMVYERESSKNKRQHQPAGSSPAEAEK